MSQRTPITLNIDPCLRLRASGGLLNVIGPGGQPLLRDLVAGIETSDGVRQTTRGDSSEVRVTDDGATVRSPGTTLRPELRWHMIAAGEEQVLRLWVEVEITTPRPLAIERIDVLVAPSGYHQTPASEVDVAQTGWQSWSRTTPLVPLNDVYGGPPPIVGPMLPPTEAERTVVPWMTLLRVPGGHGLLAGFASACDQAGVIAIQPMLEGHRFTASSYTEGVALASGATVRSETLLLVFDQETEAALKRYARELSATMDARPWPHPITGWATWYYFFTQLGEDDVLSNLRALARERHCMPINAIYNWGTCNYALDTTHPEAMEWLRSVVATKLDEWGYEYLMIDFAYAAALRGKRHDNGCTSIQAYRRGLNVIREVAGPVSGSVRLDPTAGHGVRLLSVHTHLRRPQLVGCTLHLLGGAVELADEDWSDDALTLTLRCAGEHLGELAVFVPEGYKLKISGELIGDSEFQDHLLTVPLRLVDHSLVSLRFERSRELKQG